MKKVTIRTEYITLGQLLKLISIVGSGGEAKAFLTMNDILVNDVSENRRGRKLFPGDRIKVEGKEYVLIANEN